MIATTDNPRSFKTSRQHFPSKETDVGTMDLEYRGDGRQRRRGKRVAGLFLAVGDAYQRSRLDARDPHSVFIASLPETGSADVGRAALAQLPERFSPSVLLGEDASRRPVFRLPGK